MNDRQQAFFQRLSSQVEQWSKSEVGATNEWVEQIVLAPSWFRLLCELAEDARVPGPQKARVTAAIAYFLSPFDYDSEATAGVAGFADDIVLAAHVVQAVLDSTSPAVVEQHWAARLDAATATANILEVADRMVGPRRSAKLRGMVS